MNKNFKKKQFPEKRNHILWVLIAAAEPVLISISLLFYPPVLSPYIITFIKLSCIQGNPLNSSVESKKRVFIIDDTSVFYPNEGTELCPDVDDGESHAKCNIINMISVNMV